LKNGIIYIREKNRPCNKYQKTSPKFAKTGYFMKAILSFFYAKIISRRIQKTLSLKFLTSLINLQKEGGRYVFCK